MSTSLTLEEKCHQSSQFYHGRFPDIPTFSSQDLLERAVDDESLILVDVRTIPEQLVSKIEGAISLQEFHNEMETNPTSRILVASNNPKPPTIVTYCTIGYRSG